MADDQEDLLNPDEIDGLLESADRGVDASSPAVPPQQPSEISDSSPATDSVPRSSSDDEDDALREPDLAEQLLSQAEADLEAAVAPHLGAASALDADADQAHPYDFPEFESLPQGGASEIDVDAIKDVELDLCIELGRTELLIEEVLKLREGSVVSLDKLAGDPVDIVVNGRLIARGEVLVLNDNFCVRVAEILSPDM